MRRPWLMLALTAIAVAGCGGGGSGGSSHPSSRSGSATTRTLASHTGSVTIGTSTTTGAKRARVPKHAFDLADCLRAERAATRLATDAIRHDKGAAGGGASGLMRTDLTRLVTALDAVFPSTSGQAGQLRRTRRALAALEGDDAGGVVRGLGRPPSSHLASLLKHACS